jgi:Zn-dependent protease
MSKEYDYNMRLSLNSMGFKNPRAVKKVGIRFSIDEFKELGIAILVLTGAFAFSMSNVGILYKGISKIDPIGFLIYLPIALIAVSTAFALHELAHKIVANIYNYPAAFSYSRQGLIIAVLMSVFLGFFIAAPGAVFIYGYPTKKENGIISLVGPLTNLIIGIISFFVAIAIYIINGFSGEIPQSFMGFVFTIFALVGFVNLFLGAFNLIPVMPFDGAKIWKWNKPVYLIMAMILFPLVIMLTIGF